MHFFTLFLTLTISLFAYSDCCGMISDNFNPSEIAKTTTHTTHSYDFRSGEGEFIDFDASKIAHYSDTVSAKDGVGAPSRPTVVPTEDESLTTFIEEEQTTK